MSTSSSLRLALSIVVLVAIGYFSFFSGSYGSKVTNGNIEVFYKDGATQEEAERLAQFLAREWAEATDRRSVQLVKDGDSYRFRMVVKLEYRSDIKFLTQLGLFGAQISRDLYQSQLLNVDVCDERMNLVKTLPVPRELLHLVKNGRFSVYYSPDVSKADAEKLLTWVEKEFADAQNQVDFRFSKRDQTILVALPYKKEFLERPEIVAELTALVKRLSQELFNGAPTELATCDELFQPMKTFQSE